MRAFAIAFWVLASLALAGCTDFTARMAGWYVTRKLDHYMDFTPAQKDAARTRVDSVISSLRTTEVPAWIVLLRKTRYAVHEGLTEASVARLAVEYEARLDAGVAKVTPDLAAILADLSEVQTTHFVTELREQVDESYEDRSLSVAERREKQEDDAVDALEDLVGDLSDAQERAVRGILRGLPDDRPAEYRAAVAQVARLQAFLASDPSADRIDAELRAMWAHRDDGLGRDRATRDAERRRAILAVSHLLDDEQRAHTEEELTDRIRKLQRFAISE